MRYLSTMDPIAGKALDECHKKIVEIYARSAKG